MPPPSWTAPAVLLITGPDIDTPALRSSTADAIALAAAPGGLLEAVIGVRPDLPLVVVADVAERDVLHVLSRGADHVLPAGASMPEVALAARLAIARRAGAAQRHLQRGQRPATFHDAPQLQAVARLAGGLAHEFNNLLTVVVANLEQLEATLEADAAGVRAALGGIGTAARQAAVLTRQLLAFGRQQTLMPSALDIVAEVAGLLPAMERAAGAGIRVVHEPASSPIHVRVDRAQLEDVLASLVTTAREAMMDEGIVTMATDVHEVTGEDRRRRPWLPEGRFARIRVVDTGPGLEDHALPHLFEPFFAPAPSTRRTGLAMSSVYGVVKQSEGFIWADSRRGAGTTVTILLPLIEAPARAPAAREPVSEAAPVRVLLVEDTAAVREALSAMLAFHGFAVTAVDGAEEALARAQAESFDVLVTDVVLTGRSGPSLAAEFRQRAPGVPVILMSGYSASTLDMHDLETPRAFLQKPFPMRTLVDRIHELLAWSRSRTSTPDSTT
jgi:two-component system, cell cycle sensor histidine kinase and response regulator CckA